MNEPERFNDEWWNKVLKQDRIKMANNCVCNIILLYFDAENDCEQFI